MEYTSSGLENHLQIEREIFIFFGFFENNWEKIVEINPKTCKQGAFYNNNLRLS